MGGTNFGLARDRLLLIYTIENQLIDKFFQRHLTCFHRSGRGRIVLVRLLEPRVPLPPELPYAARLGGGRRNRH